MKWKQKILELRKQGYTYNQIVTVLGCSKGTIAYHLNPEVKKKTHERNRIRRRNLTVIRNMQE